MQQHRLIAGVDEVGRGPLVGDVVTAAVILDPRHPIDGLTDSKALSEKKRQHFFTLIKEKALCWAIGRASPAEIDRLNILHATMLAMERAVEGLFIQPEHVLIDGNQCPQWRYSSEAIVKGDGLIPAISAASILAKVTRDTEMAELSKRYPQYGFERHKGYPTAAHLQCLAEHGPIAEHRLSFKPVQQAIKKQQDKVNG